MKKRLLCLLLCLVLLLSACGGTPSGAQEPAPEPVQEPTDSLTVYISDVNAEKYINQLRRAFEQSHPGVTLEIVSVDSNEVLEESSGLATALTTELAAGRGPDLYIGVGNEFKDLYKVLNTGVFCDLAPYLEDLDRENYVDNILDAGLFRGKLCFVPLTWQYPGFTTTQEALDRAGIDVQTLGTYSGLMQAARGFSDAHNGNRAFIMINLATMLFESAGVPYLDYENLAVSLDLPEFREMIDAYKLVYPQDQAYQEFDIKNFDSARHAFSLQNGGHIFTNSYGPMYVLEIGLDFSFFTKRETSLLLPIPTVDGKTNARVFLFAAVNANSKNKANAADMIKLLLQEDQQMAVGNAAIPVHKEAIRRQVKGTQQGRGSVDVEDDDGTVLATAKIITPDEVDYIVETLSHVDGGYVGSWEALQMVFEDMEPYFKDEQTYEACLQKLRSDLTIYISE